MTDTQKALAKKRAEPIRLAMARKDLLHYARYMFEEYHEITLLEAWYHKLLCDALMRVLTGEVPRLIINIPPSYGKTEFAVKLFISWALGKYSWMRFIYASYSDDLATETPADVKSMIGSPAYQKVFKEKKLQKTADKKWYLDKNGKKDGGMFSTTIAGGVTGFHGDVMIIDDPMKAFDKNSKAVRDDVIRFYTGSASTRLRKSNPNTAIIIIMQRLHENDLVGYLLEHEEEIWTHINLVGIEPKENIYEFFDFYYKREANEPLNPLFEDEKALAVQKMVMNEDWYSQYMQDPKTIETGYIIDDNFTYVATWELTEDNKCISIDPAQSIKDTADNRAITLIGSAMSKEKIELFNVYGTWFGKWTNDEFVNQIITVMMDNPRVPVFMESSGGGILTEQNLVKKVRIVNAQRKLDGKPIITNSIKLFNPKTSISKNLKIQDSVENYLWSHQIRFVIGGTGQEQVKKEYKGFHPEKDSKEDDCIETIANVVVNDFIVPKAPKKSKTTIRMGNKRQKPKTGAWRI